MLLLADSYASRNPDGSYASNLLEANWDINCLDDPTSIPISKVASVIPAFEKASPTFGAAFAYPLINCSGFSPRSTVPVPHNKARGAPPLLVIGTTRDPATPLRWAVALADQLSSAVLVTRDGDGHTGYHSENACVDATVENYLVDGTVPSRRRRLSGLLSVRVSAPIGRQRQSFPDAVPSLCSNWCVGAAHIYTRPSCPSDGCAPP